MHQRGYRHGARVLVVGGSIGMGLNSGVLDQEGRT